MFNADRPSEMIATIPIWKLRWIAILENPLYYGGLCAVNIFGIFLNLFMDHTTELSSEGQTLYWRYGTILLNGVFLVDLLFNIFFLGMKLIVK